jgi:hypothetical protein
MSITLLHGDCREVLDALPEASVLAYCAGVIDSDGTIGIKRSTYAMRVRGDAGAPVFMARCCVRQVEPQAVELLRDTFGGAIRINKGQGACRDLYQWEARDLIVERALLLLLPYLRIKRVQAENALAMRALVHESKATRAKKPAGQIGASPRPEELTARMEACYAEAKRLNKVGKR